MQIGMEIIQDKEPIQVIQDHANRLLVVQLPQPSTKNPEIQRETEGGNGVVRIKLVISKQELEMMLRKGGVSVGDLVTHMKKESTNKTVVIEDEDNGKSGRWKPILDSIPELN
nr:hypothetical protein [Tanacetum cinerariifolium]